MRPIHARSTLIVALVLAAACGKKPAPEQPTPQPAPTSDADAARARARQDSIDAANRARADAEARARAERDRAAADEAARRLASLREAIAAMIHFDFDKADILPGDQAVLDQKAAILSANRSLRLRIAGHCDERGSDEYNLALGNRRAAAAKRYLVGKGVSADRLDLVSFGEERPLDPGHDETAWAKNRRDEFEIVAGGDNLVAPQ
jgi:peptidoglycan-associated lipoprotein